MTTDRPNVVPGASYAAANQSYTNFINLNAFQLQPVGVIGGESRDQLYGPNQLSIDFSLFKDFQLHERMKLQLRGEVYNLTNTENFGQPNITITKWTSNLAGATPTTAGQFGQITASNAALNPRQFQVALKLIF